MSSNIQFIDDVFQSVADGLGTDGFPVRVVADDAHVWAADPTIPPQDRVLGWTLPTVDRQGGVIRYCPEVLERALPDGDPFGVLDVIQTITGMAIILLADGRHHDDPEALMWEASDDADDVIGDVDCDCDGDNHPHVVSPAAALAQYRMGLLDGAP